MCTCPAPLQPETVSHPWGGIDIARGRKPKYDKRKTVQGSVDESLLEKLKNYPQPITEIVGEAVEMWLNSKDPAKELEDTIAMQEEELLALDQETLRLEERKLSIKKQMQEHKEKLRAVLAVKPKNPRQTLFAKLRMRDLEMMNSRGTVLEKQYHIAWLEGHMELVKMAGFENARDAYTSYLRENISVEPLNR